MAAVVLTLEKMAAGGDALGHLPDGRVVFVTGALPGEVVEAEVSVEKRDFARATATRVLEPSAWRVEPPCPELARGCGGCAWQHIDPAGQLALKVDVVAEALRRTGGLVDAVVEAHAAVDPFAYRTSLRLAVRSDAAVGLRSAHSHRVVDLQQCLVAHPSLAALLPNLRVRRAGEVSLRVGVATGERTALADSSAPILRGLPADVRIGPSAAVHERVGDTLLRVSAASFFQSGPHAAALLVDAVREDCAGLIGDAPVLDAYGGIGLFSATLGIARPLVVESSRSACADAAVNLRGRDASIECVTMEEWTPRPVSLAIVDPARSGLGRAAVERVAASGADRIVLVSCDPVSLARDAALLAAQGYVHRRSRVLDLFPNTPHVEVITRFSRVGAESEDYRDPGD